MYQEWTQLLSPVTMVISHCAAQIHVEVITIVRLH